jgi:hypothetical protein
MADIRPDRLTTCQSERKSVVSRRPSVFLKNSKLHVLTSEEFVTLLNPVYVERLICFFKSLDKSSALALCCRNCVYNRSKPR